MREGGTPLPRHAINLMGVTGSTLLIFFSGVLVAVLIGWVFFRARKRDLRDKADYILNLARKEAELQARDLRAQAEQEIAQARVRFQGEQKAVNEEHQRSETELAESRARLEARAD